MRRREFVRSSLILAGSCLYGCGGNDMLEPTPISPTPPQSNNANPIITGKVGELRFSKTSPLTGTLYEACEALKLAPATSFFQSVDAVTKVPFSGWLIVSLLGDRGPNGWVIGIDGGHYFANSVMDLRVNAGSRLDFYYALPCSDPISC